MQKVAGMVLVVFLLVRNSVSGVMAQHTGTPLGAGADAAASGENSFAKGLDAEAIYFSERGDPVATLSVVDVERGWQEFGEFYASDPGIEYVAVTFEVSSVAGGNLVVEPYDLSLIDSIGRNNSSTFVDVAEGGEVELFEEDVAVASGETTELVLVFEPFEEAQLGYFMWQPDSGIIIIMVDLTEI
jgi:hypothetical protein